MRSPSPAPSTSCRDVLLDAAHSQLLIVDVQERLTPAVVDSAATVDNIVRLAVAAKSLGIPVAVTEHYPAGIGATDASVRASLGPDARVFEKITFSAARDLAIVAHVDRHAASRSQIVVCGLESHVCVMQSAIEFATDGRQVFVVADATSSRSMKSVEIAIERLRAHGISIVTTEMVLFEWLARGGTAEFRALFPLIR